LPQSPPSVGAAGGLRVRAADGAENDGAVVLFSRTDAGVSPAAWGAKLK
jgi:hypothetical protein